MTNGRPRYPMGLRVATGLWRQVIDHLVGSMPVEGVGLLAGHVVRGGLEATRFFPGTNLDASPTRYTMDPVEVIAALDEMDRAGWVLAAIVHSHPTTAPIPSATDLRNAFYPETLLMIVGLASWPPVGRVWRVPDREGRDAAGSTTVVEARLLVAGSTGGGGREGDVPA